VAMAAISITVALSVGLFITVSVDLKPPPVRRTAEAW
jgi:hypothetical protein